MHLRRERLVQLDEIDLVERQPGVSEHLPNRRDRADAETLRLDAGGREGDEAGQRRQAERLRARRGHDDDGGGAVARLRRVAGGDRAR